MFRKTEEAHFGVLQKREPEARGSEFRWRFSSYNVFFFLIYLRTDINFPIKKQSKILENSKEREVRREANDSSLKCNLLLGQIILKKITPLNLSNEFLVGRVKELFGK